MDSSGETHLEIDDMDVIVTTHRFNCRGKVYIGSSFPKAVWTFSYPRLIQVLLRIIFKINSGSRLFCTLAWFARAMQARAQGRKKRRDKVCLRGNASIEAQLQARRASEDKREKKGCFVSCLRLRLFYPASHVHFTCACVCICITRVNQALVFVVTSLGNVVHVVTPLSRVVTILGHTVMSFYHIITSLHHVVTSTGYAVISTSHISMVCRRGHILYWKRRC